MILVIALLIFGPSRLPQTSRLPQMGKALGTTIGEFKTVCGNRKGSQVITEKMTTPGR